MTDIVTYCDVNTCEDCPRYGDDCDGSTERLYTHKEAWGMTDLIRREDAIAYIDRVIKSGLGRHKSLNYIRKYISALPPAEAAQGEWKIDEYGIYHCPFCHAINNTVYKSFCPNCGARMKGGDDE